MSRVFTGNIADYLDATGSLPADAVEATLFCWVKPSTTSDDAWLSVGSSQSNSSRRWIATNNNGIKFYNGSFNFNAGTVTTNEWNFLAAVVRDDGSGGQEFFTYVNGTQSTIETAVSVGIVDAYDDIVIGQTSSGSQEAEGKIAHCGVLTRGVTDSELDYLNGGGDPSILTGGRYAYFPLTDSSLTNVWSADSTGNVTDLTMFGTVGVDAADNPTIGTPATTAGIDALTVQKDGNPIASTDWDIVVKLLSDGSELYNQTSQISDANGLIGDIDLSATQSVGDTVEVLGYSSSENVWFRFYYDLVDLGA